MNRDYENLITHCGHNVTVGYTADGVEVKCQDCEEAILSLLRDDKNEDAASAKLPFIEARFIELKGLIEQMEDTICSGCTEEDCDDCNHAPLARARHLLTVGDPMKEITKERARKILDSWVKMYPAVQAGTFEKLHPVSESELKVRKPREVPSLAPEVRTLLNDLLEWSEQTGGWIAPVWNRVKVMRDLLAKEPRIFGESPMAHLIGDAPNMPGVWPTAKELGTRLLCEACGEFHDITGKTPGARIACSCGTTITIPSVLRKPTRTNKWKDPTQKLRETEAVIVEPLKNGNIYKCPDCGTVHNFAGMSPGAWITCSCGNRIKSPGFLRKPTRRNIEARRPGWEDVMQDLKGSIEDFENGRGDLISDFEALEDTENEEPF